MSPALLHLAMDPADLPLYRLEPGAGVATAGEVSALVADLRRGEERAVRTIYDRYGARLTRYALVVCRGDEAAAAEAVQNAFLKAIRSLHTVADEAALWAWLARACRTSAIDQHRSASRYMARLRQFAAIFTPQDHSPPEDTEAVWHRALDSVLETLSGGDRELLDARYARRVPLAVIAAECLTTERAIEGRLSRLREKLRQAILRQLASHNDEI